MVKIDNIGKKKFTIITLGCKVNIYESEAVRSMLEKHAYEYNVSGKDSDIYIINTCSVTNVGERKSAKAIRRAKRLNPNSVIVVMGCYSQIKAEEVLSIEGVNLVMGTKDRSLMPELLDRIRIDTKLSVVSDIFTQKNFEELGVDVFKDKTRVFLKVQEGCNMYCSYCIIPYTRGNIRSRNMDVVIEEISKMVAIGYKEVVLTGIHLASYGRDLKENISLIDLVERVSEETGIERIRLGSLEPLYMTEEVLSRLSRIKAFCPQFHLSLQSGTDKILKAMNRRYTTEDYKEVVDNIRKYFVLPSITTDIIVGFPSETEEDFRNTLQFVYDINFSEVHVFKYSIRSGTVAEKMDNQVDGGTKHRRSAILIEETAKTKDDYLQSLLGQTAEVLIEKSDLTSSRGHDKRHVEVVIDKVLKVNEVYRVQITDVLGDKVKGVLNE